MRESHLFKRAHDLIQGRARFDPQGVPFLGIRILLKTTPIQKFLAKIGDPEPKGRNPSFHTTREGDSIKPSPSLGYEKISGEIAFIFYTSGYSPAPPEPPLSPRG
jgi:hypothetical protein